MAASRSSFNVLKRIQAAIGDPSFDLDGTPCFLDDEEFVFRLRWLLGEIESRCSRDHQRIRDRVLFFGWLPKRAEADGTIGEIFPLFDPLAGFGPVAILLAPSLLKTMPEEQVLTVAHELGHVVTNENDLTRVGSPSGEWARELAADRYVAKWGLRRLLRTHGRSRSVAHHLGLPGDVVEIEETSGSQRYRISRDFRMMRL